MTGSSCLARLESGSGSRSTDRFGRLFSSSTESLHGATMALLPFERATMTALPILQQQATPRQWHWQQASSVRRINSVRSHGEIHGRMITKLDPSLIFHRGSIGNLGDSKSFLRGGSVSVLGSQL
ncbi:expressed unknown protein [Seminavis robusta]|uniref:Uncharacterized protein n=1 Tax=Seminavis robusta TaxID=568900 RepID=A0A9N8EEC1_9STRA|nr:expressed unknown protein [Seminavis robusta]|eukprot:Sro968_g225941.1  (125) ;mRNA; r:6723-7097